MIDTNVALSYNLTGEVVACETYSPAPGDVVLIKLEAEGKPFSFTGKLDANGKFDTTKLICNVNLVGTYPVTVSVYDLNPSTKYTQMADVNFYEGKAELKINNCNGEIDQTIDDDSPIPFEDENFEQCVKSQLGMSSNEVVTYGDVKNVNKLDCSSKNINNIEGIGFFINLKELDFDFNQLKYLPKEIGDLRNLQKLQLYSNQLSSFPKEIGDLRNLQYLLVSNNQLTSLPNEIGNLRNLY